MYHDVVDVVRQISMAQSRRELRQIALDYYNTHGISKVGYHGHYSDGSPRKPETDGFPDEWVRHYFEDHLEEIDPIPLIASQRVKPFRWSDAPKLMKLPKEMAAYMDELKEYGVGEGLGLSVFGPNLRHAYVSLGFEHEDFDPDDAQILEYQWVAQVGHLRLCHLSDVADQKTAELSAREREVLDLIAAGKSNSVIATLMEISSHTVDAHVRRIYEKLGVNDRTSAALVAVQRGLLHYPVRR